MQAQSELTKEILSQLDMLAAKLGTTGEKLWQVLVKQAQVEAWMAVAWMGFSALLLAFAVWMMVGMREAIDKDQEDTALLTGIVVVLIIAVIIICAKTPTAVTGFANPEYWALKQVLGALR